MKQQTNRVQNDRVSQTRCATALIRAAAERDDGASNAMIFVDVFDVIASVAAGEQIKVGHLVSDGFDQTTWQFVPGDEARRCRTRDFFNTSHIVFDEILPAWVPLVELGSFETAGEIIAAADDEVIIEHPLSFVEVEAAIGLGPVAMSRAMNVPYDSYKNWRSGRNELPAIAERLLELLVMYPRTARRLGAK